MFTSLIFAARLHGDRSVLTVRKAMLALAPSNAF